MNDDNIKNTQFISSNIDTTKSRSNDVYFTNVQKASLKQKLSTKFAKYQRDSETRQKAKAAASKEKRSAKRRAADLKAMSVNIPIAAENGNPALMNTHYAPRPRAKTSPVVAAALIFLILALIAGIVVAIMKPWAPAETSVTNNNAIKQTPVQEYNYMGYDLADFDIEEAYVDDGPMYVYGVMAAAGTDVYVYVDGQIDADASVAHIDKIVKETGITDRNVKMLFELEKARLYATTGHPEECKAILDRYDEEELYDAQLGMYYNAYHEYYQNIGDAASVAEVQRKFKEIPVGPGYGADIEDEGASE